jgi:hypothetical protein
VIKRETMRKILLITWLLFLMIIAGCAPQRIASQSRNTPRNFSENRLFFIQRDSQVKEGNQAFYPLKTSYDIAEEKIDERDRIRPNSPLAIVLNGVFVPNTGQGSRDVAVVLTVQTASDNTLKAMVVDYQTGVPPGQLLNMKDLLVFSDPLLDVTNPPYFKIQVIDITKEENERIRKLLSDATGVVNQFADFIPYPGAVPALNVAVEAAKLLLDTINPNEVLLEMEVMFYYQEQVAESGGADLNQLKKGTWLVVGKPNLDAQGNPTDVIFWTNNFFLEIARTKAIYIDEANARILKDGIPYISLTMVTANMRVPAIITEKSADLTRLLVSKAGQNDTQVIDYQKTALSHSVETYIRHYEVLRFRTRESLLKLIEFLKDKEQTMGSRNAKLLIMLVNRITDSSFNNAKEVYEWWLKEGKDGCFVHDEFKYVTGSNCTM